MNRTERSAMKRGKRRWLVSAAVVLLVLTAVRIVGFWGGSGGFAQFIAGQRSRARIAIAADATVAPPDAAPQVRVRVTLGERVHRVEPEYVSLAIDLSQVTGGLWWDPAAQSNETGSGTVAAPQFDFSRPQLDALVAPLVPTYLRIGGSESDKIFYDIHEPALRPARVPEGYDGVLTAGQWNALNAFAERNGLGLVVTLNAGPGARNADGAWNPENSRELLSYAAASNHDVAVWELGNEVNNFWYVFGPRHAVSARRYAEDAALAAALIDQLDPDAWFGGQGAMIWPVLGEPVGALFGMSRGALARGGNRQRVVSWHYYPQQGRRGPIASRRATPDRLLDPANLDEAAVWARHFRSLRDRYAPQAQLWLGETGNAQFGGEPGLSDAYLGGLWWLDQLGLLARESHDVVVRQSLTGLNYGLLSEPELTPRPDYWNTLLWKHTMGREVFAADVSAAAGVGARYADRVRVYVHSAAGVRLPESRAILAINLNHDRSALVAIPELAGKRYLQYTVTTPDVFGDRLLLNGVPLELEFGAPPTRLQGAGVHANGAGLAIELPPLGYSFAVVP